MELTLVLAENYRDFQIFMGQVLINWEGRKKVKKVGNGWQINDVEFRYAFDERSVMGKRNIRWTQTEKARRHKEYWEMTHRLRSNNNQYVESAWASE